MGVRSYRIGSFGSRILELIYGCIGFFLSFLRCSRQTVEFHDSWASVCTLH